MEILKSADTDGLMLDELAKPAVRLDERRVILNHRKVQPHTVSLLAETSHDPEEREAIRRHLLTGGFIARAIISMAKTLASLVTAEGVEPPEQSHTLAFIKNYIYSPAAKPPLNRLAG